MTMSEAELEEMRARKAYLREHRYDNTPVFSESEARPGVGIHVGGGRFVTRCGEDGCGEVLDCYPATMQNHLWEAHGIEPEPLLPRPKEKA